MLAIRNTLAAAALAASVCVQLPAHALAVQAINLNGNTAVQPGVDVSAGLSGQWVFDTMNPIQVVFRIEQGDIGGVGFQFIVENETTLPWGDFHLSLSGGALFTKVGDIRPFNPAPADSDVNGGGTSVDIFFSPLLPCGGGLNACAAANDFENSVGFGDLGFASDTGVNDLADWVINVDAVQPGAAGTFFSMTFTPSLDGRRPVPEPVSLSLAGLSLAALGLLRGRRQRDERARASAA